MPATAGKAAVFKFSPTAGGAGTYSTVAGIKTFSAEIAGQNIDVTELPATYLARIQGLKDGKYSASGFYQPGDTNGQLAIRTSFLADTELWLQALPDGTTGFKQQVRCSKYAVSTDVAGPNSWSADFEGTGVITLI
jgi:predicted secreted protein